MKYYILLFLSIFSLNLFAQNEGQNWYFGKKLGLDFSSASPKLIKNGGLDTYEGCATISDGEGNLLFYTDGIQVWNKNHAIMPNGKGLGGHVSATQSAVIVPKPKSQYIYYVFTIDASENKLVGGLKYSEIDMRLNDGLGGITSKNTDLISPTCEKITAVMHQDELSYWVITHEWGNQKYHAFKVSEAGVAQKSIVSEVGSAFTGEYKNGNGYMKVSPKGKLLATTFHYQDFVEIYKFDNETGVISRPIKLEGFKGNPYGLEFSPSGKKLYIGLFSGGAIYQFDLKKYNLEGIMDSKYTVRKKKKEVQMGALQLAPNGKIYVSDLYSKYIPVINKPDYAKGNCNLKGKGIDLGAPIGRLGFPTFMQTFFIKKAIKREIIDEVVEEIIEMKPVEEVIPEKIAPKYQLLVNLKENTFKIPNNPNSEIIGKNALKGVQVGLNSKNNLLKRMSTSSFTIPVTPETVYTLMSSKEGYLSRTNEWKMPKDLPTEDKTFVLDITLDKIFVNQEITLEDIFFEYNKATLKESSKEVLKRLVTILEDNPTINIQLSAHTDCRGSESYNQNLSQQRAESVMAFLQKNSIPKSRLTAKGYGESQPAAACVSCKCDEKTHQQNRRVTFKVL
jgi:outer membrane protein OmpA-like peptidoglycan-associated protein/6-phosphogluconolactonase (cycloisomerase 2 family)